MRPIASDKHALESSENVVKEQQEITGESGRIREREGVGMREREEKEQIDNNKFCVRVAIHGAAREARWRKIDREDREIENLSG
jgi:hypothetical protein